MLQQVNPYDDRMLEYLKVRRPRGERLILRAATHASSQASVGPPAFGKPPGAHPFQPVMLRPGSRK